MSQIQPSLIHRPPKGVRRTFALLVLALLMIPIGCSKEELTEALNDAKTKTQSLTDSAVEAVEERLPESGSIALEMNPTAEPTKKAHIELISIGDGRPNVIQLASYEPKLSTKTFPAVLLHGPTTTGTASSLSGETVQCDMYYQASPNAPIAMTKPGSSVAVKFERMIPDDNALLATLGMVELVGSDNQTIRINGGEITAVIRGEGN